MTTTDWQTRDTAGRGGSDRPEPPRLPAWDERPKPPRDLKLPALLLTTLASFLAPHMFFTIGSGQVGVVFHRFGGGTAVEPTEERSEGFGVIAPWDIMQRYELRIQKSVEELTVLSKEGLEVHLHATTQYRPIKEQIGLLHKEVGPDYLDRVIIPEVRAILRVSASRRMAEEIFTAPRDLQEEASEIAARRLAERHVRIDGLLITEVRLPEAVQRAIDDKQRQAQVSQEYDFRIEQEEKESIRREIEARGLREFQGVISEGLSEPFLRWRSIEATLELAKSNNSKVVVLGGAAGTTPLLLNMSPAGPMEASITAAPAPSPAAPTSASASGTIAPGVPPPTSSPAK